VVDIKQHRGIACSLAAVSLASGSYSIIDRIANALSEDSVIRAIYENSRILENLIRRYKESRGLEGVAEKTEGDKREIIVKLKDRKEPFIIHGYLASEEQVRKFIEESSRDIGIARAVASYAMSMVAYSLRG